MKLLLSLAIGLLTLIILSTITLSNPNPIQAATTCTATASKTVVAPGETFEVTVDFSDNNPHNFNYFLKGTKGSLGKPEISGNIKGTTDPFTFTITAPDQFFSGVRISEPINLIETIECFAQIKSSLAPPPSPCQYDFDPKSVDGGAAITITVTNTLKDYQYKAIIRTISAGIKSSNTLTSQQDGQSLTLNATAPDNKGTYEVTITASKGSGAFIQPTQDCFPQNSKTLNVISDKKDGGLGSGKNPCDIPDPNNPGKFLCPTAFGNIPTTPEGFVGQVLKIGIGLAGGLALILMVIGSIRVLTSSGDQQRLSAGRDMIVAAVVGLLFLIFSVLILRFIGINLLGNLNPFT